MTSQVTPKAISGIRYVAAHSRENTVRSGWYKMWRGWMDSPVFGKAPYSEREAWMWLIENAVYIETTVNIAGHPVILQRGQLSYSVRYLAEAWRWRAAKAQRFMDKLKKWKMVDTRTDTAQQIITICNYLKYQNEKEEADTGVANDPIQKRYGDDTNKKKTNNTEETKNIMAEFKNEFWPVAIKKVGKDAAMKAYLKARARADKEEIHTAWRNANRQWASKINTDDLKFVPHPSTWLNEGRWQDELAEDADTKASPPLSPELQRLMARTVTPHD